MSAAEREPAEQVPFAAVAPPQAAVPPRAGRRVRDGLGPAIVAALTERVPLKAAALFFSIVLWLIVSTRETAEQLVPVRLAANVDPSIGLVGPTPAVRALVVGRASDLIKLGEGPLVVHRVFTAETPDSVRVELRPSDIDLPAGMAAVVRDVQPRAITLRFAPTSPREAAARRRRAAAAAAATRRDTVAARESVVRSGAAARDSALAP